MIKSYFLLKIRLGVNFLTKSYTMSSINNENRYNIKLVFGPGSTLLATPLKGEILVFSKICHKTKFRIKIMKFVAEFEKSVLESWESPLGGYPQTQSFKFLLALFNDIFRSKIELVVKKLIKASRP